MNATPFDLPTLQSWMQSVMMSTSTEVTARASIEDVITASSQQTSCERLDVYSQAYFARLMECLREEFATMCQMLGQDAFDGLAFAYLRQSPSRSYTLANLGAAFPAFLVESAEGLRDGFASDVAGTQMVQFLQELATLERLYAEVFDGPGLEGLPPISVDELQQIAPANWPNVRFEPAPCLRLVDLNYPVHEFITACRHGTEPPLPEPRRTWLAVTRRQYVVRRLPLTEQQFKLLSLLSQRLPLGEALEQVTQSCEDLDSFSRDLQQWFRDWTAAGFFRAVIA